MAGEFALSRLPPTLTARLPAIVNIVFPPLYASFPGLKRGARKEMARDEPRCPLARLKFYEHHSLP